MLSVVRSVDLELDLTARSKSFAMTLTAFCKDCSTQFRSTGIEFNFTKSWSSRMLGHWEARSEVVIAISKATVSKRSVCGILRKIRFSSALLTHLMICCM